MGANQKVMHPNGAFFVIFFVKSVESQTQMMSTGPGAIKLENLLTFVSLRIFSNKEILRFDWLRTQI